MFLLYVITLLASLKGPSPHMTTLVLKHHVLRMDIRQIPTEGVVHRDPNPHYISRIIFDRFLILCSMEIYW